MDQGAGPQDRRAGGSRPVFDSFTSEELVRLAIAVAIGLLIGDERERSRSRGEPDVLRGTIAAASYRRHRRRVSP